MKQIMFFISTAIVAALLFSCTKEDTPKREQIQQESNLFVSIVSDVSTRASGSGQGVQADDNAVQTLELFVFRTEGEDSGNLDAYKKFTAAELTSLANLEIKTTTGAKKIYAVANSHKENWKGIITHDEFLKQVSDIQKENLKDFTMVGSVDATLQATTSVTLSISRLVARVQLANVTTKFAGTPYEGASLSNVKVYLINAYGSKTYATGEDPTPVIILNSKKPVAEDINASAMKGMLYEEIPQSITDAGYATSHYFYCYENVIEQESADKRFTKLVIQGDMNGHTYYYPISINREDFGYTASNGKQGVERNTAYALNVTILRPGSLDPDKPVEHGVLSTTVNVLDWSTTPTVNVEF